MTDFAARLAALRLELDSRGLSGFVVPMADAYQSEYVSPSDQRVKFLSGFTGSAAFVVVLKDRAAFFTDSRYTLQASQQVDGTLFAVFDSAAKSPPAWLEENLRPASEIGYDPWLHAAEGVERLKKAAEKAGARAVAVADNPVDAVWRDRPAPPAEPVVPHDLAYAGKSSAQKRRDIAAELKKKNIAAAVIADPASVAWLLNVRGNDVAHTPLPLSRAILRDDAAAQWFVDPRKLTEGLPDHLGGEVTCLPPERFPAALEELARAGRPVLIDLSHAASRIVELVTAAGGRIEKGEDPCELPKACKNAVELEGMRACHRRDGAALVKFFAWLDQEWRGGVTELQAEARLAALRAGNTHYRGPSFDTIAGAGEHGAIVHYRATRESDAPLKDGQLFLLDSGGQYLDGTTDVTRTVALGAPSPEMRDRFTRVLKGHIALSAIRFPEGTSGGELDVLARQYLWDAGLDYGHGTGHGVGCYLGVHEGPQAISKRSRVALKPGMVVSNEPGFYKAGAYGIRVESLQSVVEVPGGGAHKMLGFETMTLCPIDRKLVDAAMLTRAEIAWLNAYHVRVLQVLRPMIDDSAAVWLEAATLPLAQ